jgi:NAD(P)-dependent dehydrogenase (short-subunit alcohol dehydrogenase family)
MKFDFSGQVAVVTGGSDGIGRATSELLAASGAHVVILARGQEKLDATKAAIVEAGGSAEVHSIDLMDAEGYGAKIAEIAEAHGRLDMLVNNAMSVHYAPIEKLTLEHWRKDFAVNSEAVFAGTQAAITEMRKAGKGSIVNISSTTAIRAAAYMTSYSASKAAMIQFSAVAAMECARDGIRINCIVPGQLQTAANEDFASRAPEVAAKTQDAIPMGRGGEPAELAASIVFLLSDAAAYITGVALPVDGGKAAQLYLPS